MKNLILATVCGALFTYHFATGSTINHLEYSVGFTASRGLLSIGKVKDLNYFGVGLSKEFYAGSTGFFAGPNFSFERRFSTSKTPFLGFQYNPIFSSKKLFWNYRDYNEGLNFGQVSASAGYQFEFKKFGVQAEISTDKSLVSSFEKDWRIQWGLGVSYIGN